MELSEQYLEELRKAEAAGTLQIVAGAMAHALQAQLHHRCPSIKHACALDDIMRGVSHAIEGRPEMKEYVLNKIGHGTEYLRNWM